MVGVVGVFYEDAGGRLIQPAYSSSGDETRGEDVCDLLFVFDVFERGVLGLNGYRKVKKRRHKT